MGPSKSCSISRVAWGYCWRSFAVLPGSRAIMSQKSLEDVLRASKGPVDLLRNQQTGPNAYPGVPAEYTNWRDEQRAWQQTCVLFNQSYHMAELMVEGPDALEFLNGLGINSFKG